MTQFQRSHYFEWICSSSMQKNSKHSIWNWQLKQILAYTFIPVFLCEQARIKFRHFPFWPINLRVCKLGSSLQPTWRYLLYYLCVCVHKVTLFTTNCCKTFTSLSLLIWYAHSPAYSITSTRQTNHSGSSGVIKTRLCNIKYFGQVAVTIFQCFLPRVGWNVPEFSAYLK